jgi:hypothetical protein
MAVRRRALLDIGGFDERLGPGASAAGEEADLVVRLAAGGWQAAIADAPVMQHVDWRDPAEEAANQLVYERGAGVWLGAGLRRDFGRVLPLARLRLRYQRALYGDRQTRGAWFGPRTSLAFAAGLLEGGRMRPRRFVRADSDVDRPVRVMAIGSGPVLGDAVRREADADLVIVWDRSQVRSVTHRRFARWVAYAPRGTRRAAVRDYDGLITDGSPLPWTSALPVWSRDDAARVLETVAPGHRR